MALMAKRRCGVRGGGRKSSVSIRHHQAPRENNTEWSECGVLLKGNALHVYFKAAADTDLRHAEARSRGRSITIWQAYR